VHARQLPLEFGFPAGGHGIGLGFRYALLLATDLQQVLSFHSGHWCVFPFFI
jgi:hypothetical protein